MPQFNRTWNDAYPPDTQQASQLGLDIRQLTQDVREHFAYFSGVLSERPTPTAEFGSATYGTLFFSTDTQQIFRWDGGQWQDVTQVFTPSRTIYIGGQQPNIVLTAAPYTAWTAPIPAITTPGQGFRVISGINIYQIPGSGGININYSLGGVNLYANTAARITQGGDYIIQLDCWLADASNGFYTTVRTAGPAQTIPNASGGQMLNTSALVLNQTNNLTVTYSGNGYGISPHIFLVERIG